MLRMVKAHDRGRVLALAVADQLANLNNEVFRDIGDESVGPRCIVAWRNKPGGGRKGGGSHQAYVGTTRADAPLLPTIGAGRDVIRSVLRMVKAHDRGRVLALAVADQLANLNNEVFRDIGDESVGPRCIVAWRNKPGGGRKGGGSHQAMSARPEPTPRCSPQLGPAGTSALSLAQ